VQELLDLLRGPPFHLAIPFEHVGDAVTAGQTWFSGHYTAVASRVMASAGTITEAIATIVLSVFLCVFFLASGRQMWHWILGQFPKRMQHRLSVAFGTGFVTFAGYARGEVLISLIDGILAALVLTVLRIPLAVPLAVLVFIGSFIPLIGAPAAMLIAGVVALAVDGPVKALIVIICVALIGQLEAHLWEPFLMGHQVKLHPVVVALSVASGTMLAGILGAVLAVPLVAVTWRVYQKLRPTPEAEPTPTAP
jgi:predicted PurR-regulated permease PerM